MLFKQPPCKENKIFSNGKIAHQFLKQHRESVPSSSMDTKLLRQKVKLVDSDHKAKDNVSSGSSIDAAVDGTFDQRAEGECFCSFPAYQREV